MEFTREEREIIKGHIKAIENYCKTEIIPLINGYTCVDVSETQYRRDGSPFKKTYLFSVDTDGRICFVVGASTHVIDEKWDRDYFYNAYEHLDSMKELLVRWQRVKAKLIEEINRENKLKSEILNFQV